MYVKLFVGNLPWSIDDLKLEELFESLGDVQSARVITDRDTGRSRGFGFVEMDASNPNLVISTMNGKQVGGRELRVNEAEPRNGGNNGNRERDSGRGGYSSRGGRY